MVALKRAVFIRCRRFQCETILIDLLGAGIFGDSFCALAHSVLGQFTRQQQTNSGLNFPTGDGRSFVVVSQTRCFGGNAFENIINKTVHDTHGFARNTSVWMHLLQHFVDVDGIRFLTLAFLLLVAFRNVLLCLAGLLRSFSACLWWHVYSTIYSMKLSILPHSYVAFIFTFVQRDGSAHSSIWLNKRAYIAAVCVHSASFSRSVSCCKQVN